MGICVKIFRQCEFRREKKAIMAKNTFVSTYEDKTNQSTKVRPGIGTSLRSFSSLDKVSILSPEISPLDFEPASESRNIFCVEVGKLKKSFDEKMERIRGFLSSLESQFFEKNHQFFMQVIVNDVSMIKNVEYDLNIAIQVYFKRM